MAPRERGWDVARQRRDTAARCNVSPAPSVTAYRERMMTSITRRELARLAASWGAALALGCRGKGARSWRENRAHYPQGVASGDPTADSVVLWTRRAPLGDDV